MSSQPNQNSEARDLRALLGAVLDAITLPHNTPEYAERIEDRASIARVVVREALDEDPARLGWNADWLRSRLATEQAEAEEREKNRCGRCRTPFDPTDTRFDGRARHQETPWCRRCVDNCHEGSAEHVCMICDPARYGGEDR
ncbi:hypothetical protein ACFYZB_04325 [Streptomyces sp. NPDC001852]|uniref:hypothetical protein n=1 Tax=Streptomyces sp. NPDC001852 TaxID=3364619 RepID=UPI0036AFC4BB